MDILRVEGLTKKFGNKLANNNINLTVKRGEIYGLIGKNGAGKTTLMRQMSGSMKSTSGSILWGQVDGRFPQLGVSIESNYFNKSLCAFSLLKYYGNSVGSVTDDEIDSILRDVGLQEERNKKIAKYSTGMKQKLSIALALIDNPEFLILDEPINGLDPSAVREIRELLIKLNIEKNVTMIISSHIISELSKIASLYGVIVDGTIVKEVSADTLADMSEEEKESYFLRLMEGMA